MFDIIGKRNWFFGFSIAILLAGIIGWLMHGFTLDIQFKGGTIMEFVMENGNFDEKKAADVASAVTGKITTATKSQALNANGKGKNVHMLTLSISSSLTGAEQNKLIDAIRKDFSIKKNAPMNISNVEPYFGKELMKKSIWAVLWTIILIIVYIAIRFRVLHGWSTGVFSILALLHDALIMLTVYAVFRIPLNDSFVAAVLTILGFSINDTVIIFDRVRENTKLLHKVGYKELVNRSIWQTMTRSINTTATTVFCVLTVYIVAKIYNISSMTEFAFPMLIGLVSGVYSTVFIAGPMWVMWREHQQKKRVRPAKA